MGETQCGMGAEVRQGQRVNPGCSMLHCVPHLPSGLDATNDTNIEHTPSTCQAEQDPPLDGA